VSLADLVGSIVAGLPPVVKADEAMPTAEGIELLGLAQLDLYEWAC